MFLRKMNSIVLLLLLSCGGGGGGGDQPAAGSNGGGGGGGTTAPSVPNSVFFESCADATCTYKKLAQVNTEVTNGFSLVAETGYQSTSTGTGSIEYIDNKVYFSANTVASANFQLWVYDPLAEVEIGVNPKDISSTAVGDINFQPERFKAAGSILYFSADTTAEGRELWKFDTSLVASATNPSLVVDFEPGTGDSNPTDMVFHNNKLFYAADRASDGIELRVYDPALGVDGSNPSTGETRAGSSAGFAKDFSLIGDLIYFSAWDGVDNGVTSGIETWVFDTTMAISGTNPRLEVDFEDSSLPVGSLPEHFVGIGSYVYFTAQASGESSKLRKYDPSLAVSASNPSTIEIESTSGGAIATPNIRDIFSIGTKLYFNAEDVAGNGDELWVFDTSLPASTSNPQEAFDLNVGGGGSIPTILGIYGNMMAFTATTSSYGNEVWLYDSSQAISIGTNPVVIDSVPGVTDGVGINFTKSF